MSLATSPGPPSGDSPDPSTDPAPAGEAFVEATEVASEPGAGPAAPPVRARRRVLRLVLDGLAVLVVLAALVLPDRLDLLSPAAFLRLPLELLVGAWLVVLLPRRSARILAGVAGALLGLLTLGNLLDMGFYEVLARPFDPVLDGVLVGDAFDFLTSSVGRAGAVGVSIAAVLLVLVVLGAATLAALRLAGLLARHRSQAGVGTAVLSVVWVTCAVAGAPFAADNAASTAWSRAIQVRDGVRDQQAFAKEAGVDAFASTPGSQLLTGLRGKNVIIAFVESYGRSAVQDPRISPGVDATLDSGTAQLAAAGFHARSAFLTSPTYGGGSWLAHSTLLSGLWIDNQQRYMDLVSGSRLTLDGAFHKAGWRTVGMMPGVTRAWPEGKFYGFDKIYDSHDMGYAGPHFSWAPMPDQYALSAFQRLEHPNTGAQPEMMEIPLVSSHAPWAPLPRAVGWDQVGDGSVFDAMPAQGATPDVVWRDASSIRAAYAQSIEYSLNTLVSYLRTYGNDNTVLVFLGDHQPAPIVTGQGATHDVPITIVARSQAVLDQISGWGWQDGLHPSPNAPVWRMDTFRDRFLTAFGSRPSSPASLPPAAGAPAPAPATGGAGSSGR